MNAVGWVVLVIVVVGILVAIFGWDRYRGSRNGGADGGEYKPTDEVFTDPATGRLTRVWYDATTGERDYRPE